MLKTKNLFALMALGSALTLVGCGDDEGGSNPPVTTADGGADAAAPVDPTSSSDSSSSDSDSSSTTKDDAGSETIVLPVDGGTDADVVDDGEIGRAHV